MNTNSPRTYPEDELIKPVTLGVLLEFTDEVLIPRMAEIMDDKIGVGTARLEHSLKSYIDDKLADYTSDIFKRLDKKYEKDRQFKSKVVEIFRTYKIGTPEDVAYLDGLAHGI